jgi:hypothetical protein
MLTWMTPQLAAQAEKADVAAARAAARAAAKAAAERKAHAARSRPTSSRVGPGKKVTRAP